MNDIPPRLVAALADRYRFERELGQGGMASVYLAQDLKIQRQVAIKVLRPELAAIIGADRFLSEIRTTANLQHPNILPLHDSGEADSFLFYVMPFVEGESLRDRLTREKQLPIPDTIGIATEVAGALDYAHRHGVVHRDIKPENILLHDGRAMVADFGIALAASKAGGTRMTETGMSLGTPTYMSPEQAMGERTLDARSDIYALGCVTYEMLLGEAPFTGPTAQAIVAKMMTERPAPIRPQRDTVSPEVEAAVLTALAKLPADRFATAAEYAAALNGEETGTTRMLVRPLPAASRPYRWALGAAIGAAILAALAAVFFAVRAQRASARPLARFTMHLPYLRSGALTYGGNSFVLSPDGSKVIYIGAAPGGPNQLWMRNRDDLTPHPISGTDGADGPFFSPDSRWIGYFAHQRLFKISAAGGQPIAIADSATATLPSGAWLADDRILYISSSFGLLIVPASGGTPVGVPISGVYGLVFPAAVPHREAALLTECINNCSRMTLVTVDIARRVVDTLLTNTARGWILPGGELVAVRQDGSVVGARFDPATLRLRGAPVPLLAGVQLDLAVTPDLSIANDGTLLYVAADSSAGDLGMVRVDRQGRSTPIDPAWRAAFTSAALSPDGRRLAVSIASAGRTDLWVKQLDRGPLTRLTFNGSLNYRPAWRPDGRSLSFTSDRDGLSHLFGIRADGSGQPERILAGDTSQIDEANWSVDGRWLVFRTGIQDGTRNIFAVRTSGDTSRIVVTAGAFDEYMPAISPDGRWVAYVSVESGREEVYVRPLPQSDRARWQVSTSGGAQPVWSHDGRELFYVSATDSLISVSITPGQDFQTGARKALFSTRGFLFQPFHQSYAVEPGDRAFVLQQRAGVQQSENPTVVLNWFEEVRAKLAAPGS